MTPGFTGGHTSNAPSELTSPIAKVILSRGLSQKRNADFAQPRRGGTIITPGKTRGK